VCLTIGGRALALSNLDKALYPQAAFTKGDVLNYYARVAGALLPHLKDRAVTLKRFPDGVEGVFFYQKRCPIHRPPWIRTAPLWSDRQHERIDYCLLNDPASLIWAANLAALEFHPSLAGYRRPDRPTVLVFDLDPGTGADLLDCAQTALWLREYLAARELKCFAKTSGSKGLQIYVPLNTPVTFEQTKSFAREAAQTLTGAHANRIVSRMEKRLRPGKVFIDWSQNDRHKTTVSVYSLRARERPTVSAPVQWSEVESAIRHRTPARLVFEAEAVLRRVARWGDLFEPVLTLKQKLPRWEA
jgi:bifunctional non-homologous end joining protein LigD